MHKIVAFGEIMLRLAVADGGTIAECKSFEACYGGTEANVLACLTKLGCTTSYLSALPENELGEGALAHLKALGVGTEHIVRGGNILGAYFVSSGSGSRGATVVYNRAHAEITRLDEDAYHYDEVFKDAALFHISGISFALSGSSRRLAFRLVKEAKARKIPVSFDFNYRAALWPTETAGEIFRAVLPFVDIALASPLDLSVFLHADEENFFKKYPCEYLVLRERKVLSKTEHAVRIKIARRTEKGIAQYETASVTFPVDERIGGGDAFDGALLYKLLKDGGDIAGAADFALGAFALKHRIKGDTFTKDEHAVCAYARELGLKL